MIRRVKQVRRCLACQRILSKNRHLFCPKGCARKWRVKHGLDWSNIDGKGRPKRRPKPKSRRRRDLVNLTTGAPRTRW